MHNYCAITIGCYGVGYYNGIDCIATNSDYNVVLCDYMYGTAQEQVNILARVGTRNKVHAHANLSHTRGASQTTHAIHEVHVSQHASQKPIPRVFKL